MTGANKGIGYAIVKKLCKELSGIVILTGNFGDLFTVFIYFISEHDILTNPTISQISFL